MKKLKTEQYKVLRKNLKPCKVKLIKLNKINRCENEQDWKNKKKRQMRLQQQGVGLKRELREAQGDAVEN